MFVGGTECGESLLRLIEERVRRTTHGRIRDLSVAEEDGRVVLRGEVPSWHARQLALHAALECISEDDSLRECLTVR